MSPTNRRQFLKSAVGITGAALAPNILLAQTDAAKALRVAAIGCGGKGLSDITEIAKGNQIAFLCDVDRKLAQGAIDRHPDARFFSDYREMFASVADQIDVVTISTPDHMHFPIAMEAIRLGKPLMVQKPLTNNLWEARMLSKFAEEKGVLNVMGNQGATFAGTRVLREWIDAGLIGEVTEVHYWTNRPTWPQGPGLNFPPAEVPEHLNWEVWQGSVATERPYSPKIHPFAWRAFWDYGCGALGDIGCHSFNSAFWVLDLRGDFSVEPVSVSEFDDNIAPLRSSLVFHFPARGKRGPVKVFWQDGSKNPQMDPEFKRPPGIPDDLVLNADSGQVFVGTEGVIYVPDMYCKGAPVVFDAKLRQKAREIPRSFERINGGPTQELVRAIRGEGPKPLSSFADHAGPLTEMALVGNLALRTRKQIDWSAEKLASGQTEADAFIKREYRKGWEPKIG